MNHKTTNPRGPEGRIVSGSLILLTGSAVTTAVNLLYNIVVARALGPRGYGMATVVYTLLTLMSAVTLSYQIISAKLVAQQRAEGEQGSDSRRAHRSSWICGIALAGLLLLFSHPITSFLNLSSQALIPLLAIGVAFYVPLGSRRGLVQGEHRFVAFAINMALEGIIRLGGSVLAIRLGAGVDGVIAANSAAVAVAYLALPISRSVIGATRLTLGALHRELGHAAIFFSGQMLINNVDIVLVKHFFASNLAGVYAVVAMVGRVVFALCQAVVNSMVPIVAGTSAEQRKGLRMISTAGLLVLSMGGLLALALYVIPATVWTHSFGAGFTVPGPHGFPTLLALYALSSVVYSLSAVLITYEMSYKIANASWVQLAFSFLVAGGISLYHGSLTQVIVVQLVLAVALLVLVSVPIVRSARAAAVPAFKPTGMGSMQILRQITRDEVIAEFLKSDFSKDFYGDYHDRLGSLVDKPDLASGTENALREALFTLQHAALWKELPTDTQWYEVELKPSALQQIRMFPRAQWRKLAAGDFSITSIARRMAEAEHPRLSKTFFDKINSIRKCIQLEQPRAACVLLIGINETAPLTVLDGNHRFVAAVMENCTHQLRFFCGFSPSMDRCCWYKTNVLTLAKYAKNLARQTLRSAPGASMLLRKDSRPEFVRSE